MSDLICVYTDGACRGNPGPGGWGALIVLNEEEITLFGGENNTTNNRMEMTAAIEALSYFSESSSIKLTTDSNYLKDGKLIVFPTETVFGLGAIGNNEKAISGIYTAKNRPKNNLTIKF